MNNLFFIGLPYISILIFLMRAIYKYRSWNDHTALKAQLLKGSLTAPLFAFGLAFLVLGHLIGLICPSCVLAWNGQPVRLVVLELGAFGLSLATLFSFVAFLVPAITRPGKKPIDILFYSILLLLIASGLWVANFNRWGSSWSVAILTPYLRSLLKFSPDISAVQVMVLPVKIHIISAFSGIALLPFTRWFDQLSKKPS